uniref:Uncharacterized protein n=1 Tax=Solanum tuberosum TaxID=4113 RepID=M1BZS9_SOLTU
MFQNGCHKNWNNSKNNKINNKFYFQAYNIIHISGLLYCTQQVRISNLHKTGSCKKSVGRQNNKLSVRREHRTSSHLKISRYHQVLCASQLKKELQNSHMITYHLVMPSKIHVYVMRHQHEYSPRLYSIL